MIRTQYDLVLDHLSHTLYPALLAIIRGYLNPQLIISWDPTQNNFLYYDEITHQWVDLNIKLDIMTSICVELTGHQDIIYIYEINPDGHMIQFNLRTRENHIIDVPSTYHLFVHYDEVHLMTMRYKTNYRLNGIYQVPYPRPNIGSMYYVNGTNYVRGRYMDGIMCDRLVYCPDPVIILPEIETPTTYVNAC